MAGMVFNIQRYSIHDGPGIRTIVFLKGCPLRCKWCSNPESRESETQIVFNANLCVNCGMCMQCCPTGAISTAESFGKVIDHIRCTRCGTCIDNCQAGALKRVGWEATVEETVRAVCKDTVFFRKSGGGVTLSGGEPYAQPEFVADLLRAFKEKRISSAVETTGSVPFSSIQMSIDLVDLFLYDVKHMDSVSHERFTGVYNARILDNIKRINDCGKRIWIRVPLISGVNDSMENMERTFALADSLDSVERVEILPYHEYGVGKYAQLGLDYELAGMRPPDGDYIQTLVERLSTRYRSVKTVVRQHS